MGRTTNDRWIELFQTELATLRKTSSDNGLNAKNIIYPGFEQRS